MIRYIIVDDEKKALINLEKKVKQLYPDFEHLGSFSNPVKALKFINDNEIDLVFLDIEMPNLSGFDLLSKTDNPDFEIIFVTAYNQYAIDAIKHAAIGYIVKPIDIDELKEAIEKAKENIQQKIAQINNKKLLELLTQQNNMISIPTQNGYAFVKIDNIVRLEGIDGYTKIKCKNNKEYFSSYSLGKFYEMVQNHPLFFQAHRSHIVNLKFVTGLLNEGYIELEDQTTVPLSRTRKKLFLEMMSGKAK